MKGAIGVFPLGLALLALGSLPIGLDRRLLEHLVGAVLQVEELGAQGEGHLVLDALQLQQVAGLRLHVVHLVLAGEHV